MIRGRLCLLLLCLPVMLHAEEEAERFILPETPPTIERLITPPLDRPLLKKRNFIAEASLSPSQVWQARRTESFVEQARPADIRFYHGSFASMGALLRFASSDCWNLDVQTRHAEGEEPRLAVEQNLFRYSHDAYLRQDMRLWGTVEAREDRLWVQRRTGHRIESNLKCYPGETMCVSGRLDWERTLFAGFADNDHLGAGADFSWQSSIERRLNVSVSSDHDTGFVRQDLFTTVGVMYRHLVMPALLAGAGARYQLGGVYPQAECVVHALSGLRFAVEYRPGVEKPRWAELYPPDRYVMTDPSLAWQKNLFFMSERVSYYWGQTGEAELSFRQKDAEDYVVHSAVPGSDFVVPVNLPRHYSSAAGFSVKYAAGGLAPELAVNRNFDTDVPFKPAWNARASLAWTPEHWSLSAGCEYSSEQYVVPGGTERLPGYGALSCEVKRSVTENLEVFVAGENLLGAAIARQPGFVNRAPLFQGGIAAKF